MPFGQLVTGPPGSGKSTYCNGMQQYLTALGRKVAIINLDPANDKLPYDCAVDLIDLVSLEQVMKDLKLGPNGGMPDYSSYSETTSIEALDFTTADQTFSAGLVYCMEHLVQNLDWLQTSLKPFQEGVCEASCNTFLSSCDPRLSGSSPHSIHLQRTATLSLTVLGKLSC